MPSPPLMYVDPALLAQRKEPLLSYLATNMLLFPMDTSVVSFGSPAPNTAVPLKHPVTATPSSGSAQIPFPSKPPNETDATLTTHSRSPVALYSATNRELANEVNVSPGPNSTVSPKQPVTANPPPGSAQISFPTSAFTPPTLFAQSRVPSVVYLAKKISEPPAEVSTGPPLNVIVLLKYPVIVQSPLSCVQMPVATPPCSNFSHIRSYSFANTMDDMNPPIHHRTSAFFISFSPFFPNTLPLLKLAPVPPVNRFFRAASERLCDGSRNDYIMEATRMPTRTPEND